MGIEGCSGTSGHRSAWGMTTKLREWLQQIHHQRSLSRRAQFQEQIRYCVEPSSSEASGRGPELERGGPAHKEG